DSIEIANLLEGFFTLGEEVASPFTAKISPKTQVKLAEGWQRVLAYAIDNFILNALFVVLFQMAQVNIYNNATSNQEAQTMAIFYIILALIIYLGYQIISGAYSGQTFGKMIVGIRVVRQNGQPLRISDATLRAFGYLLSSISIWAGFLWALMDEKRQGWHDKIAKTLVIKTRG
ncbi:MAG: RDD family protein, partial [Anaerolineae bacterium]|nr:RDD family protein [Anaerolineae bacterium]